MDVLIDTNILVGAVLKDGFIREAITYSPYKLYVPEFSLGELEEHKQEILEKFGFGENELYELINRILTYLQILPDYISKSYKKQAENIISTIDPDDVPIVAASLALNSCPIWSDDGDLQKQDEIEVITTEQILTKIKNND